MRAEDIDACVRKQPFEPFRVFLSDGSVHDVRHPEMIKVTRRNVGITKPSDPGVIPETFAVFVDPVHITRIEPVLPSSPPA